MKWEFSEGLIICKIGNSFTLKCDKYVCWLIMYRKCIEFFQLLQDACFNSTCCLHSLGYPSSCCGALLLERNFQLWHVLLQAANRTSPPPPRFCRPPPPICLGEGSRQRTRSPSIPPSVSRPVAHL
jgi:hypothetical protein